MTRWLDIVRVSRPLSWVNTAIPFAVGAWLVATPPLALIIGSVYFLFPYNLLMYGINDIYDYPSDLHNPRKSRRSLEGSIVAPQRRRSVWLAIILTNLPFLLFFALATSPATILVTGLTVSLAIAYSLSGLRFKEIPGLDSLTSSLHFVGPFLVGVSFGSLPTTWWPAVLGFVCWGMASHAFGAIQDSAYDRASNMRSIATVLGAQRTVWLSTALYGAAAALVAVSGSVLALIAAISLLAYAVNTWRFRRVTEQSAAQTRRGWRTFLLLNYLVGGLLTILIIGWQVG